MRYRFAIVGCGNVAARHAARIQAVGALCAVCDINPARAASFGERFDVPFFLSLQELLEADKPDVLVICTPNGLHYTHTAEALRAGCHVLCEKPMTITSTDATKLISLANETGKKLFVVKQNRYNPLVVAVKEMIDKGKLGEIKAFQINCFWNRPVTYYQHSWRGTRDQDGGTLFTQFSHFIDLLYWYLGEIDRVQGWRANFSHVGTVDFEDTGTANIVMKNGALGTLSYTINAIQKNMEGSITLFGSRGTVKIGGQYLDSLVHFEVENEIMPLTEWDQAHNMKYVYEEVIRGLNNQDNTLVKAEEAIKSIEMIEKIYASSPFLKTFGS